MCRTLGLSLKSSGDKPLNLTLNRVSRFVFDQDQPNETRASKGLPNEIERMHRVQLAFFLRKPSVITFVLRAACRMLYA